MRMASSETCFSPSAPSTADIGVGPQNHGGHPVEFAQLADGVRAVVVQIVLSAVKLHRGQGEKLGQFLGAALGAGPRPLAAVGGGEGLVQVELAQVEARVPGPGDAHQAVEVGLVIDAQTTGGVDDVHKFPDFFIVNARVLRVGDQQGGGPGGDCGLEGVQVGDAALVGVEGDDLVAQGGGGARRCLDGRESW